MNDRATGTQAASAAAEMVARRSYGKLVALLAARTRNLSAAEDALADAFAAALAEWPRSGCPANPEAWLLTVARRRCVDGIRRRRSGDAAAAALREVASDMPHGHDEAVFPDRRLGLLFACAHPAIDIGVRAPLMLQTVLGLDAKRIASAFLMSPSAVAKRLVRAKTKIRAAAVPLRVPERDELAGRLDGVLDAILAAFTDGWQDPAGIDSGRRDLADEAVFLARLVAALLPQEPEAAGLLACLLFAQARRHARRDARGDYVPLDEQDVSSWDPAMIREAEETLRRASGHGRIGRRQLEAALQSAHVERRITGRANAEAVRMLHDALLRLTGSPVVAINRALAIAATDGADAALAALPDAAAEPRLATYQPYWAARAALLALAGAHREAHAAYETAIGLEHDDAVRRFLRRRQSALPD